MKGSLNGICNMSSCRSGQKATWYNHGSRCHYCEACAKRLNADPYNMRDAAAMFGHDLCTPVKTVGPAININLLNNKLMNNNDRKHDNIRTAGLAAFFAVVVYVLSQC